MSDIFISYASEDRDRVQSLARALERVGWSVWWDRRIPTGRPFDEVIQEELDVSKAVVVVWTTKSVKSHWVKNEARRGLNKGKTLLPLMLLEEVEIPFGFEHLQAAQLMDWQPEEAHSGFDQFVQDIAQVLGPPSGPGVQQPPVKQLREQPPSQTKPASGIESLSGRAGQVEQEGGLLERKPSTPTAISAPMDLPGESLSSLAEAQSQEGQIQEPEIEGEGRVSEATDSTPPLQPQRYILIGVGLLLAMGALVAYWIWSQGSSPGPSIVKSDGPAAPATVEPPRTQSTVTTPPAAPAPSEKPPPNTAQKTPTVTPVPTDVRTTATKPRPIAGSAKNNTGKNGAPMVLIPAGEFQMGSLDGEGEKDERPRHQVSLDAFYMDKFEVTVARYAEFVRSTNRSKPKYWDQVDSRKHGNLPVVGVDWQDAEAYCRWAEKRLPTEAEWEKAARGTDGRRYPWGNEQPTPRLGYFGKGFIGNVYDSSLTPVESYEAGNSPYGLHHMAGNVGEWTADWYDEHFYAKSPQRNPTGPSSGTTKVLRGGGGLAEPVTVRSANRYRAPPITRDAPIGFRCAQDSPK